MNTKQLYQKEIQKVTEEIKKKYKPEKIILFGSCARNKITKDSDVDMLIIKKRLDEGDIFIQEIIQTGKVLYER